MGREHAEQLTTVPYEWRGLHGAKSQRGRDAPVLYRRGLILDVFDDHPRFHGHSTTAGAIVATPGCHTRGKSRLKVALRDHYEPPLLGVIDVNTTEVRALRAHDRNQCLIECATQLVRQVQACTELMQAGHRLELRHQIVMPLAEASRVRVQVPRIHNTLLHADSPFWVEPDQGRPGRCARL